MTPFLFPSIPVSRWWRWLTRQLSDGRALAFVVALLAQGGLEGQAVGGGPLTGEGTGVWKPNPLLTAPLSSSEQASLGALFQQVRPATFLISDCPLAKCTPADGLGTGFLIGSDGTALTAYHVVFGVTHLSVTMSNGQRYRARLIGYDDQRDLAVLKVEWPKNALPRPFLRLTESQPNPADAVLVIGNGGGTFLRPKTGRLQGIDTASVRADFAANTLQIAAPVLPGDSGGPVLSRQGQVVGVVSFLTVKANLDKTNPDTAQAGISKPKILAYAVPVSASDPQLALMKKGLKRDAPVIGVGLNGPAALLYNLPAGEFLRATQGQGLTLGRVPGAFFTSVTPGSPAARAGLKAVSYQGKGDVVTHVNGQRVMNFSEFQSALREYLPGQTVTLNVLRGGKTLTLKMKLVGRASVKH